MKSIFLYLFIGVSILLLNPSVEASEELYIITTRDGSATVARDYKFTDEYLEFTTENGLPGYIKRTELVKIDNMIGVPAAGEGEQAGKRENESEAVSASWVFFGVILTALVVLVVYFLHRNKPAQIRTTGKEKEQKTGGHLAFEYREPMGRTSKWTIDVRRAYEKDDILYVEGVCTVTDKKKKFRADRVVGPVTDVSDDKKAPMEKFFTDVKD